MDIYRNIAAHDEAPSGASLAPKPLPSSYDHRTPEGQEREARASRLFAAHYGTGTPRT